MNHEIHQVKSFEIVGDFTLRITFEDGFSRIIDFSEVLAGEIFGKLRNPEFFNQVRLDTEIQTLVWPNEADFDPETLYNWPKYSNFFIQKARELESRVG